MQDTDPKMKEQIELEKLYNKNQLLSRLRFYFEEELRSVLDFTKFFEINKIDKDFGFSLLVQMALHRRTTLPTMVGILRHHFDDGQKTADLILKCCELDLLHWDPNFQQLIVDPALTIPEGLQRELDLFQFPLPMIVEPRKVKDNRDTGYLTNKGSIILKKNHHSDDVCLQHINKVNAVPMSVNLDTAMMVKNSWRNLDKPKDGETKEAFDKRRRAFEKYDRTVWDAINTMIEHGNRFWLTHKFDKRGRTYCQGYHLNTQGNSWSKAILELADKEIIG